MLRRTFVVPTTYIFDACIIVSGWAEGLRPLGSYKLYEYPSGPHVSARSDICYMLQTRASSTDHRSLDRGFEPHHPPIINFCTTFPMSNLKNTLPGILRKWNRVDIDASARICGRPAIPPFRGGSLLQRLVWVGNWSTFGSWVGNWLTFGSWVGNWLTFGSGQTD